jgi:SET domain-containing protein
MPRRARPMFSLSPVEFRNSSIAGRGVFARRRFEPGDRVVAYAPNHRRLDVDDPEAITAAATKVTLASEGRYVIVPDTTVPGGWLCNHSCDPNASLFSSGEARIVCRRPIAPGDEITIFYGWVTRNEPKRDRCACASPQCRGFINFDVSDDDSRHTTVRDGQLVTTDETLRARLEAYGAFLRSIGQEQVQRTIASMLGALD